MGSEIWGPPNGFQSRENCIAVLNFIMSLGTFLRVHKEYKITMKNISKKEISKKKYRLLLNVEEQPPFEGKILMLYEACWANFRFCRWVLHVELSPAKSIRHFVRHTCHCWFFDSSYVPNLAREDSRRIGLKIISKSIKLKSYIQKLFWIQNSWLLSWPRWSMFSWILSRSLPTAKPYLLDNMASFLGPPSSLYSSESDRRCWFSWLLDASLQLQVLR